MQSLMVKILHAKITTEASSNCSYADERVFRNAPFPVSGFGFIHAVEKECRDVNQCQINYHTKIIAQAGILSCCGF